ncbi:transcription termination factor 5, mitochondrial [Anopheles stephensi]|uniref:transcription termination factor 5, mitochondrial n=1 Tax=Anopheles stephensi TaxID=30069 RepID=UPI001658B360|nr:transcription termination factor 5, mitochondrial [Anopheles stephensi]
MLRLRTFYRTFCQKVAKESATSPDVARLYAPHIGAEYRVVQKWLLNNPALLELDQDETVKKLCYLKYVHVTPDEILEQPQVLFNHLITLENRTTILRECGLVEGLTLNAIGNYLKLIRKSIVLLKRNHLIPKDLDMYEQLKRQFECAVEPKLQWDDRTLLQDMRIRFFNEFLTKRLDFGAAELEKLWKSYSKIKHKSFGHTQRVIDILQYDYKFSRDKLVANMYLLHADPENLLRFPVEVPTIGGIELKELVVRNPKIMMVNHSSVKQVIGILKQLDIPDGEVLKSLALFTLSPKTIEYRLERLMAVKEFEVLTKHPRVLRLIQYHTKAALRLEYLQQLKVRCASLDVLSSNSQNFERYVREGCDKTKGKDTGHVLKHIFKERGEAALKLIKRHPNWYHVPVLQMQETVDALLKKKFTLDDIFNNIHVLLYPLNRIEEKLTLLQNGDPKLQDELGVELYRANKTQLLALALYLVELDFHFTGDGVWPEQVQQSDSSSTINVELPSSLSGEYKFGKKPPSANSST